MARWFKLASAAMFLWLTQEAGACTQAELATFVERAQSLQLKVGSTDEALLTCDDFHDQAIWWLAFDQGLQDKAMPFNPAELYSKTPAREPRSGSKEYRLIIKQARNGQYRPLLTKIDDEAALGFIDNASAQLALARALAVAGQFERSRRAYLAYLRLVNEDLWVETEYEYTFIWEANGQGAPPGSFTAAVNHFRTIANSGLREPLSGGVKRGLVLLENQGKQGADHAAMDHKPIYFLHGLFQGSLGMYSMPEKYRRTTGSVVYNGLVNVRAAQHRIDTLMVDTEATNATEFALGKGFVPWDGIYLGGEAGYFSAGDEHFFGEGYFQADLPWRLAAILNYSRKPLSLQYPLVNEDQGLMRDTFGVGLNYGEWVEWRSELHKDLHYTASEYHLVNIRVPLWQEGEQDFLYVKFPLSLEIFPRPSPNYPSDPRTSSAGFGFDYARRFEGRWDLKLTSDYSFLVKNYRGDPGKSRRVGRISAGAEAIMHLVGNYKWFVKGFYSKAEEEDTVRLYDRLNFVALGVLYDNF